MGELHETLLLPKFVREYNSVYDSLEETENGMYLNNVYIPVEVMLHIFTFVHPQDLLNSSLVCRNWNRLIKSFSLWSIMYRQKYHHKPKQLPWYIFYCLFSTNYFDNNLLKNGNGQEGLAHWVITNNGGDGWIVENPPVGADPLPSDVSEFYNYTSCFATSFSACKKTQNIKLANSGLFKYILNVYKPHIYVSEWTAGRFDCGCIHKLKCTFVKRASLNAPASIDAAEAFTKVTQWDGSKWRKIEIRIPEYPHDIDELVFEHGGRDTQFWAGHYGSKMAGGVLRFVFDSIEPLILDENGRPKLPSSSLKYETNGEKRIGQHLNIFLTHDYNDI